MPRVLRLERHSRWIELLGAGDEAGVGVGGGFVVLLLHEFVSLILHLNPSTPALHRSLSISFIITISVEEAT
jgi:hypothetical protein